jgi:hypothetical protein
MSLCSWLCAISSAICEGSSAHHRTDLTPTATVHLWMLGSIESQNCSTSCARKAHPAGRSPKARRAVSPSVACLHPSEYHPGQSRAPSAPMAISGKAIGLAGASISPSRRRKEGVLLTSLAAKRGTTSSALHGSRKKAKHDNSRRTQQVIHLDVKRLQALDLPVITSFVGFRSVTFACFFIVGHSATSARGSEMPSFGVTLSFSRAYLQVDNLRTRRSSSLPGDPPELDVYGRDTPQTLRIKTFGKTWIAGRRQSGGPGTPSPWKSLEHSREARPLARYHEG